MINITLPYPDSNLNPNVTSHYHVKSKIKGHAKKSGAKLSEKYQGELTTDDRISMILTIHRKDKRKYDIDNVLASMKSVLDGVADGIGYDDNQVDKIVIHRGAIDKENPRIEVSIERIPKELDIVK